MGEEKRWPDKAMHEYNSVVAAKTCKTRKAWPSVSSLLGVFLFVCSEMLNNSPVLSLPSSSLYSSIMYFQLQDSCQFTRVKRNTVSVFSNLSYTNSKIHYFHILIVIRMFVF